LAALSPRAHKSEVPQPGPRKTLYFFLFKDGSQLNNKFFVVILLFFLNIGGGGDKMSES
jgi:hypothetical protein